MADSQRRPGFPLLLLDVDGVLNALGRQPEDFRAWAEWRTGSARAAGTDWPITFAPEVTQRLGSLHEHGLVEVQWLTTWGHEANDSLRELLGLPELDVAGTYDDEPGEGQERPEDTDALAGSTPSAPDLLEGSWWKHDVVRKVMHREPGRRLVWVDDELTADSPFMAWTDAQAHLQALGPNPLSGLTPADLATIERWAST